MLPNIMWNMLRPVKTKNKLYGEFSPPLFSYCNFLHDEHIEMYLLHEVMERDGSGYCCPYVLDCSMRSFNFLLLLFGHAMKWERGSRFLHS